MLSAAQDLPLVLLLGWAGSEDRHLESYASWYQSQGLETLIHITQFSGIADPSQAHKIIDFLAQRLRFVASERPVIVHLFSNNGFFAYASLLRHPLSGDVLRSNVCAQIFDSSPGVPEPLSAKEFGIMFQRALEGIFRKSRWPIRKAIGLVVGASFGVLYRFKGRLRDEVMAARPTHRERGPLAPIWAIYGPGDDIVPERWIEAFLRESEGRGIMVHRERFEGSAHVEHWLVHRRAYQAILNRVVSTSSQPRKVMGG